MCRQSQVGTLSNIKLARKAGLPDRAWRRAPWTGNAHNRVHLRIQTNTPQSCCMIPFQILRLDHVVLRVADLDRSIHFYATVLGCAIVRRRDDLGLIHLRAGVSLIDLVSIDGPLGRRGGGPAAADGRNMDHLCLRIGPFDAAAVERHVAAMAIEPSGPVRINFGAEGEGPSLYIQDPDGNTIELKGPSAA